MSIVVRSRFAGIPCVDVWWPARPGDVEARLGEAPVVRARQCDEATATALGPRVFRRRPSPTLLIDLTRPVEALREDLHPKSCRAKVRRAEESGCRFHVGESVDEALALIAADIARQGYTAPPSSEEWQELLRSGDVFGVTGEGRLLAAHVFLADGGRARMLYSGTVERTGKDVDRLVGSANRFLHWQEMIHYRERGLESYDFGGIDLDPASRLYSISQFKLSFGGRLHDEESVYVAGRPALRSALRAASRTRLGVRRALRRA
jgi:Acetyltransferase (GNAT) domain